MLLTACCVPACCNYAVRIILTPSWNLDRWEARKKHISETRNLGASGGGGNLAFIGKIVYM